MKFYNQPVDINADLWSEILSNQQIINDRIIAILKLLHNSDKHEARGGEIAGSLGYSHHAPLNAIIPNFSKRILREYPSIDPPRRENGDIRYWHIPFLGTEGAGAFIWILRQELAEALSDRYGPSKSGQGTEIVVPDNNEEYFEGIPKETSGIRYERDPKARGACLKHYGFSCQICGFDFENFYGPVGKGIIVVHHITPISERKKEHKIDPTKDLIPVCPNCHELIHSRREIFTVAEIKSFIKEDRV